MPTEANAYWKRLHAVIRRSELTTTQFAQTLGYARPEVLFRIKKGKNAISRKLAERIVAAYPEIRKCWLLCGEGPMLCEQEWPKHGEHAITFYCSTTLRP